jgi:hypothetical protein
MKTLVDNYIGEKLMINVKAFLENISEETLKKMVLKLSYEDKVFIEGSYDFFIDFLKNEHSCTQYICSATYEEAKNFIIKLTNCFNLNNFDVDELYNLIKANAALVIKRSSDWITSEINLLNEISNDKNIKCTFSEFKYINKWGYESDKLIYRIIHNDQNVFWVKNSCPEPQYFVLKNEKIYGIRYTHKLITIYKNMDITFKEIPVNNNLDDIIIKYNEINFNIESTILDLSQYFYTGFFYKGILFDVNWKNEISILKNIKWVNGLLRIEIENLTYPHSGYVLLDIENNNIIEVGKIIFSL